MVTGHPSETDAAAHRRAAAVVLWMSGSRCPGEETLGSLALHGPTFLHNIPPLVRLSSTVSGDYPLSVWSQTKKDTRHRAEHYIWCQLAQLHQVRNCAGAPGGLSELPGDVRSSEGFQAPSEPSQARLRRPEARL